jgi:GT2 family glycosyltransferase
MQPLVYIIVLNWNGHTDTMRCVASLERQLYTNRRILIVDNGSTDGSIEVLRGLGDRACLIEDPENRGYSGGNNRAMRLAFDRGADYVWLFNNDAVAEPNALTRMIDICEADFGIGLASPLILEEYDHDVVQSACGLFDLAVPDYTPTNDVVRAQEWHTQYPDRIGLVGTAMLVRRAAYEKIGELDDHLFAYWEDYDYSIRSALAGFRNMVVFEASIFHRGKPATDSVEELKPHYYYYMSRNEILMWRKFCSRLQFLRFLIWIVRQRLVLLDQMPDNPVVLNAVLAGLWDGLRGMGGVYDPNRRIPFPFRELVGRNPRLWIRMIDAIS